MPVEHLKNSKCEKVRVGKTDAAGRPPSPVIGTRLSPVQTVFARRVGAWQPVSF